MSVETLFVVDDDPTGAQGQQDVPLLLSWPPALVDDALASAPRALHLLTNSRALTAKDARAIVRDACKAIQHAHPAPRVVLRGDSTLRGHLLPEHRGLCEGLGLQGRPPLLLVPALPAAGRVTQGGCHWLVQGGARTAIADSDFAADTAFGYTSSRLLDWAEERSGGHFAAAAGCEIPLSELRSRGGVQALTETLVAAARRPAPSVVVPDAETDEDLRIVADALRSAWAEEARIVVRCAPAFASVLSGASAQHEVALPVVRRGLLVVVGSHVALSSAQLEAVRSRHPSGVAELEASALAGAGAEHAVQAAVDRARGLLAERRVAIVATSRRLAGERLDLADGMRVALGVASVVRRLRDVFDVLLSKGGITSAVNVRHGLNANRAEVIGPVAPGVSLWHAPSSGPAMRRVIVFPGNVGSPEALADLIDRLLDT